MGLIEAGYQIEHELRKRLEAELSQVKKERDELKKECDLGLAQHNHFEDKLFEAQKERDELARKLQVETRAHELTMSTLVDGADEYWLANNSDRDWLKESRERAAADRAGGEE